MDRPRCRDRRVSSCWMLLLDAPTEATDRATRKVSLPSSQMHYFQQEPRITGRTGAGCRGTRAPTPRAQRGGRNKGRVSRRIVGSIFSVVSRNIHYFSSFKHDFSKMNLQKKCKNWIKLRAKKKNRTRKMNGKIDTKKTRGRLGFVGKTTRSRPTHSNGDGAITSFRAVPHCSSFIFVFFWYILLWRSRERHSTHFFRKHSTM